MDENLEERVASQFAPLYLTFTSVMTALVLGDLFMEVHSRMVLQPLNLHTLRVLMQIFGNSTAILAGWITYSHLGLLRRRLPTIWDSVDAMLILVAIPMNAETGRDGVAAYFFWGAAYSLLGLCAVRINLWQATLEPMLSHVPRLGRFGGPYTFLYLGIPGYLAASIMGWLHLLTPAMELAVATTGPVGATVVAILFLREWRETILAASTPAPSPPP
jgi:hypothetical protein